MFIIMKYRKKIETIHDENSKYIVRNNNIVTNNLKRGM